MNTLENPISYKENEYYKGRHYFWLKNVGCEYSLELPYRGGTNKYPQSIFEIKK